MDFAKEQHFMLVTNTTEEEVSVSENEWLATIEAYKDAIIEMKITDDTN